MNYARIDTHRKEFELTDLCRVLDVSVSGYRTWKDGGTPERKRPTDAQMLTLIRAIPASKERVERPMRENGIRARHKLRFKATTDSRHRLAYSNSSINLTGQQ